jgi:MFS family permease
MSTLPDLATTEDLQEPLLSIDSNAAEDNDAADSSSNSDTTLNKDITLPKCWGEERFMKVNHNVFLNLILAAMYGISGSLWNGTAYVAYLKHLGHDRNGPLGDIEAVSGLATLVTALPVGYLADRLGRSKVIRAGGILLLLTTFVQIAVMEWVGTSPEHKRTETALFLLGMIMWLWGVGDGVVNGPCAALYADSTPRGERSVYYNYLFACYSGASAVGPLVSIVLFETLGDDWSLYDLRIVIYVGLGVEVFNSIIMMFFDDKKALDESEEESDERDGDDQEDSGEGNDEEAEETPLTTLQKRQKWIPYIIFIQSIIFAIGSGMTIKFFPLFFKDEVGMSPSQVQVIYCAVPFAMVICSTVGSKVAASGVGRVQTQLLSRLMGISLLYCMVFFKNYLDKHPILLVPIYVMRTSLMNACYPLQESILMDFVPKSVRGRWKSLDAVAAFGWCGSAAFGGWLADKYDYTYTFFLTAIIQSVGLGVWCLLLPLVPRHENEASPEDDEGPDEVPSYDSTQPNSTLHEPLLSDPP